MSDDNWSDFLSQARSNYEEFQKEIASDPHAQADSAIVGDVGPILKTYYPEFPHHAFLCRGAQALLSAVINEMWGEMLDLAATEGTEGITKFAATVERKDRLWRALNDIRSVTDSILIEFTQELRDQLDNGLRDQRPTTN